MPQLSLFSESQFTARKHNTKIKFIINLSKLIHRLTAKSEFPEHEVQSLKEPGAERAVHLKYEQQPELLQDHQGVELDQEHQSWEYHPIDRHGNNIDEVSSWTVKERKLKIWIME